jgi:hypothetical protein
LSIQRSSPNASQPRCHRADQLIRNAVTVLSLDVPVRLNSITPVSSISRQGTLTSSGGKLITPVRDGDAQVRGRSVCVTSWDDDPPFARNGGTPNAHARVTTPWNDVPPAAATKAARRATISGRHTSGQPDRRVVEDPWNGRIKHRRTSWQELVHGRLPATRRINVRSFSLHFSVDDFDRVQPVLKTAKCGSGHRDGRDQ